MITLGLVDSVDDNGVYVTMPGSKGVLRGPYKALSTVAAGTTVLVASTDDGETVVAGVVGDGGGVSVKAFGAKGDGVTDDSVAVRAALAAAAGGVVCFPDGVYVVSALGAYPYALQPAAGTTLEGPGTVKLADDQADGTSVFSVVADAVTFRGLTIDGNESAQSVEVQKQRHGIICRGDHLIVERCTILSCAGDGILLDEANDASISGNRIDDCVRNAITLYAWDVGSASRRIRIIDNDLYGDAQPIDSEPEGGGVVDDVQIIGNRGACGAGEVALTITGSSSSAMSSRWTVVGNVFAGPVIVTSASDVQIVGNVIDCTSTPGAYAAVHSLYQTEDVTLSGNRIIAADGQIGVELSQSGGEGPTNWIVADNTLEVPGATGINVQGAGPLSINGNRLIGDNSTATGVKVFVTADMPSVTISGNDVRNFSTGVYVETYSTYTASRVLVTGNNIDHDYGTPTAYYGIRFYTANVSQLPQCIEANNTVSTVFSSRVSQSPAGILRQGFYGAAPAVKPTVTGSRGGNAALQSLLTALAGLGLITDSSS